ncbi:MAG: GldG family protein [Candidatus Muirbacterium halophilum]|nr:GldG family protein [Candidatus Muirbacterium halophilum]MCK9475109.1 GldG family protein [Candidatus Muirbacterium halophilum]
MKKSKRLNYRVNNFMTIVIVFLILVFVNLISNIKFYHEDISESMMNSLSNSTLRVLEKLHSPLEIYAFFKNSNPGYSSLVNKLEEFRIKNNNIKIYFADVDKNPEKAIELGVKNEMLVFFYKDKRENVYLPTEERITGAINSLLSEKKLKLYFLKGHGEKSNISFEKDSISIITSALKKLDFEIEDLYLSEHDKVPEDCDILIIASPKKAMLLEEEKKLEDYFDSSGKIFLSLDTKIEGGDGWESFLYHTGVEVYGGVLVDYGSNLGGDSRIPAVKKYRRHFITERLSQTFFPLTLGLREAKEKIGGDFYIEELVRSDINKSYIETGETHPEKIEFDSNSDIRISAAIVIASKKTHVKKEDKSVEAIDGRIVVCGDTSFITDDYVEKLGNGDLFLSSIEWLAEDKDILAINLTNFNRVRMVELTNIAQQKIFWISVVIIPLLIALFGILIVYRREHE